MARRTRLGLAAVPASPGPFDGKPLRIVPLPTINHDQRPPLLDTAARAGKFKLITDPLRNLVDFIARKDGTMADRTPIPFDKLPNEDYVQRITWSSLPEGSTSVASSGGNATAFRVSDNSDQTEAILGAGGPVAKLSATQTTHRVKGGAVGEQYIIRVIADLNDGQNVGEIFIMTIV